MNDESEPPVDERYEGSLPRLSPTDAAATIEADATVGVSGFGSVGYPKVVPLALADDSRELSLTIVSGGSVGGEIDTALVEADAIDRRFPYQATAEARAAVNDGTIEFGDRHISRLGDEVRYGRLADLDIAVVEAVAVGENWLIPSTSIGHTSSYVAGADRLIVEVNEAQPLSLRRLHDVYLRGTPPDREPIPLTDVDGQIGSPRLKFDAEKLTAVVESDRPDKPYSFRDPTDTDERVAANLAAFLQTELDRNPVLSEAVNLQFGVGSLGNALMGALKNVEFGDRQVNYFGEVIQDGLLELLDTGVFNAASATSLALSRDGQQTLFESIDNYADEIVLRPADISNNPALIDRFGVVGVNSALEVDLFGHANSTHVGGTTLVNGIGGSGDFNRNCAVPILALPSTAADGDVSRVVPMVPHVDHTEHDLSIVVTERGVADLRGRSPRERARLLIENCAHPRFRDELNAYLNRGLQNGGHIPHDTESAFTWFETG